MALTLTTDNANIRESGAATVDYYDGLMGKPVVFSFTNVSNGLIFNCGFGAQWAAWENTTGTPFGGSGQAVGVTLVDDRITFNVTAGGPFSGNVWVFYRRGCGDARASSGGQTIAPSGISEIGRRAQKLRMTVWNTSTVTAGQTSTTNVGGVQHMIIRTLGSDTGNQWDARFASDVNHALGRPTAGASGGARHLVFLTAGFGAL